MIIELDISVNLGFEKLALCLGGGNCCYGMFAAQTQIVANTFSFLSDFYNTNPD